MTKKITTALAICLLLVLQGCGGGRGSAIGGMVAGVITGEVIKAAMSSGGQQSATGGTSANGRYEACDSPQAYADYLTQLGAANPMMLGWGGLAGGEETIRKHCRMYAKITPLRQQSCVDIGRGYQACPAIADDTLTVWTQGREPSIGTGLLR